MIQSHREIHPNLTWLTIPATVNALLKILTS